MSAQITLPPEIAARLRAEADRRGVSSDACAAELLDRTLPPAAERAAAVTALFAAWEAEDRAVGDEPAADRIFQALDEDRPADSPLFPDELKGVTW